MERLGMGGMLCQRKQGLEGAWPGPGGVEYVTFTVEQSGLQGNALLAGHCEHTPPPPWLQAPEGEIVPGTNETCCSAGTEIFMEKIGNFFFFQS